MAYSVLVSRRAQRDMKRLRGDTRKRIRRALDGLATEPRRKAAKLAPRDSYRIRVGDYRIVFVIDDDVQRVLVVRIAHRRDVYRR